MFFFMAALAPPWRGSLVQNINEESNIIKFVPNFSIRFFITEAKVVLKNMHCIDEKRFVTRTKAGELCKPFNFQVTALSMTLWESKDVAFGATKTSKQAPAINI